MTNDRTKKSYGMKEPIRYDASTSLIVDADDRVIIEGDWGMRDNNSDRFIACVNACINVPTEDLELCLRLGKQQLAKIAREENTDGRN